MHAVIALCYFCENHGPRVVMVCQPMRNGYSDKKSEYLVKDDAMETDEEAPRFYGDIGSQEDVVDEQERCAACSSFGDGLGILSNDHEAATSYVSTQAAIHERVHNIVLSACLRSLLVEVSTPLCTDVDTASFNAANGIAFPNTSHKSNDADEATDGVVFFGDEIDGYVLSQTFRLKDAKARGFKRRYSLIVVSKDKLMLLSNYEFFLGGFSAMIAKLQTVAEEQCVKEQQYDMEVRIAAQSNRGSYMPQQFYPRKVVLDTSRSLTEITNNKDIFVLLHRQMLYLLRVQTMLEQDVVLEGVPTQDMLVLKEMKQSNMEESDLLMLSVQHSYAYFYNLRIIVNKLRVTNPDMLTNLIWHVIVGGQVVVRSNSAITRQLFLLALMNLVPLGCVKLLSTSLTYQYSYKYNFLGCSLDVEVPEDVKDEVFEIEIDTECFASRCAGPQQQLPYECTGSSSACSSSSLVTNNSSGEMPASTSHDTGLREVFVTRLQNKQTRNGENATLLFADDLEHFNINFRNAPSRSGAKPAILKRYLALLVHPLLNINTLESSIRSTRHDWLNRAKLIFQLRHQKEGIDIGKVIKIIKCNPEDSPVLLFWQSGLSRRYKQVVLNTINNTASSSSSSMALTQNNPRTVMAVALSAPSTQGYKMSRRTNSSEGEQVREAPSSRTRFSTSSLSTSMQIIMQRSQLPNDLMDTSSK